MTAAGCWSGHPGFCRRLGAVVLGVVALAGCADRPPLSDREEAALTAARTRIEHCVGERLDRMAGVSPPAARALARSLAIACRTERDAFEATAGRLLGADGAEAEMAGLEAWIFREAERHTLEQRF